jgi:hypothetical protein
VCLYIDVTHVHKIFLFMCSNLYSIFNHFLERFQVNKFFSCAFFWYVGIQDVNRSIPYESGTIHGT